MRQLPANRLVLLAILVLIGLGLFFALAGRTPVVVQPTGLEAKP